MLGAALCCVAFRVNLPLALITTLYTNPLTIVPLYVAAFAIGRFALGGEGHFVAPPEWVFDAPLDSLEAMLSWVYGLGKPLALGLVLLAGGLAIVGYFAVKLLWRWRLLRAWRQRKGH